MMPEPTTTSAGIIASLFSGNEGMTKISYASMGFIGSLISMQFIDHMNRWQRVASVATSIILADVGGQPLAELSGAAQYSLGAAAMIGLFGFSLCGAFIKGIKQVDIAGIIKNFFDAINSRISGGR